MGGGGLHRAPRGHGCGGENARQLPEGSLLTLHPFGASGKFESPTFTGVSGGSASMGFVSPVGSTGFVSSGGMGGSFATSLGMSFSSFFVSQSAGSLNGGLAGICQKHLPSGRWMKVAERGVLVSGSGLEVAPPQPADIVTTNAAARRGDFLRSMLALHPSPVLASTILAKAHDSLTRCG